MIFIQENKGLTKHIVLTKLNVPSQKSSSILRTVLALNYLDLQKSKVKTTVSEDLGEKLWNRVRCSRPYQNSIMPLTHPTKGVIMKKIEYNAEMLCEKSLLKFDTKLNLTE